MKIIYQLTRVADKSKTFGELWDDEHSIRIQIGKLLYFNFLKSITYRKYYVRQRKHYTWAMGQKFP
jgi:hypothetical protein